MSKIDAVQNYNSKTRFTKKGNSYQETNIAKGAGAIADAVANKIQAYKADKANQ